MNNYFSVNTLYKLVEHLPAKIGFTVISYATGTHAQLVLIFIVMAMLDVLTRWLACSAALWKDMYPQTEGSLWKYFKFMRQSHRWRYFQSEKMRDKFISKIGTYTIIIIFAALGDYAMAISKGMPFLLTVVVSLLACTEMISCLENLNECNVSIAKQLLEIVKARKEKIK